MTEDDAEAAALRLEQALDRIARMATEKGKVADAPAAPAAGTDPLLAARLDQLIAQLRGALHS